MTYPVDCFTVGSWAPRTVLYCLLYNSNKSPTRCNNFPIYYPYIYLQLNMFRAFSRPSSGAQWLQWQPLVLPSYSGDSCAVFVAGWLVQTRTQHSCHHDTKVKPEAATAVELLMMGGRTPKTCWAVNKCQDNKLENCCIWLVIYLNCTMMHGLTNLKCLLCVKARRQFKIVASTHHFSTFI
jgi:hypothetical protein